MPMSEMHVYFQSLQIYLETPFLETESQLSWKTRVGRAALSVELGGVTGEQEKTRREVSSPNSVLLGVN